MPSPFDGGGFQQLYYSAGFTRWMHRSTTTLGDMAVEGYFDEAVVKGFPVKPGDVIDALGGRNTSPRMGFFVVDDVSGGRVTVTARTAGDLGGDARHYFGNPTDNNTQFFQDMLDDPGIYTIPVGTWRIPDLNEYRLQPGVRTFIGIDPEHCILDFSESTAQSLLRLALGAGYKFRFINIGMRGVGTARFIDLDDWPSQYTALGLDFDSLVVDELLFDNVDCDLWETLWHGDHGFGAQTPPPEWTEGNLGIGTAGNFLTVNKTTVRNSRFTNIWDCPIEHEMGRIFNSQYRGNFYSRMGQNGIANGYIGLGVGGRNHSMGAPGIQGSSGASGAPTNPAAGVGQHPEGDIAQCIIGENIFHKIGFIGDTPQPKGSRSTAACLILGDRVVITNNVVNLVDGDDDPDVEGFRGQCHAATISGNVMYNAGLSEGFMRFAGGPADASDVDGTGGSSGEKGMITIVGNALVNTRFGSGGSRYTAVGGIGISFALVTCFGNVLEGMTRYPIRFHGWGSSFPGSVEALAGNMINGNLFRKCGLRGGSASGILLIDQGRQTLNFSDNVFERCWGNNNHGLVEINLSTEAFTDAPPAGLVQLLDNIVRYEDPELEGQDRRVFDVNFGGTDEPYEGLIVRGNQVNACDTFMSISGGAGVEVDKLKIAENDVHSMTTFLDKSGFSGTILDQDIYNNPGYLDAALTHDFGTVNAGTTGAQTVTVTDAEAGDVVRVRERSGGLAAGLFVYGRVTGADTVTVYCANVTGGNIAVGSLTYDVWVERRRDAA